MCGIAGIALLDGSLADSESVTVERMVSRLAHRGPDHSAVRLLPAGPIPAALGYSSLSILDLSPAGNQPMSDESGEIRLVYNGELYNHRELRVELEAMSHRFRSRSDTETVAHAYESSVSATTRDIVVSDVTRARATRIQQPIPVPPDAWQVYDNGLTQLYHVRPQTPYQP